MIYFVICINDFPEEVTTDKALAEARRKQLQDKFDNPATKTDYRGFQHVWIRDCPEAKLED